MLEPDIQAYFISDQNLFDQVMRLRGEVFRALENRRTQRIKLGNNYYFLKQHYGIGWKEIFKNLFQLRLPVLSAKNEWQAIQHLEKIGVPTMKAVGYDCQGINPAHLQSFLMTKELAHMPSLEDVCQEWKTKPPPVLLKRRLIKEVARLSRLMHESGMNHRDFYLCHFLLASDLCTLHLIDLHRAQIRSQTPLRWKIKDLAGLYFSSKENGLTTRDLLRFVAEYTQQPLRSVLTQGIWQKVKHRGDQLYKQHGK